MAKSQQSFEKREKEKKRLKKREEKRKKKEVRKALAKERGGDPEFAYVDQYGHLTNTPPDDSQREEIDASSIDLGIPKKDESAGKEDPIRKGKVAFFNHSKGFGFITDTQNQEKYFCHISGVLDEISENDQVSFELEKGSKGMNAVNVRLRDQ